MSSLINNCVKVLEKKNIKSEMNALFKPLIDIILMEIYPYIYISMIFIIISFLLILGIFLLLLRNNYAVKPNII